MVAHLSAVTNQFKSLCTKNFDLFKKFSTNVESGEEIEKCMKKLC